MTLIWRGARGPVVRELQATLAGMGLHKGVLDGDFGPQTERAVTAFQRAHGLTPDGIVGPQTAQALASAGQAAPGRPESAPAAPRRAAKIAARDKVFISYSHVDRKYLDRLHTHLAALDRMDAVEYWDDTKIAPGSGWRAEIAAAMQATKVAVLLVSADFMASEFIANHELPRLLTAAAKDGVKILPVSVSPCHAGELGELQWINPPSRPLVKLDRGDREQVWFELVEAITSALND